MQTAKGYTHVIWDWNGTLFDDVDWCLEILNTMLSKRGIKTLRSIPEYHSVFCFPIIDYYKKVGFDFSIEPFEELAEEYIALYHSNKSGNCKLFPQTESILAAIKSMGVKQVILTASEMSNLLLQMSEFDIGHYFDELCGLTDIYGKSKADVGLDYVARNKIGRAVLIGDSKHDFEVATAMGVDCVLIAAGHHSKDELLTCGAPVLDSITQVVEYL